MKTIKLPIPATSTNFNKVLERVTWEMLLEPKHIKVSIRLKGQYITHPEVLAPYILALFSKLPEPKRIQQFPSLSNNGKTLYMVISS